MEPILFILLLQGYEIARVFDARRHLETLDANGSEQWNSKAHGLVDHRFDIIECLDELWNFIVRILGDSNGRHVHVLDRRIGIAVDGPIEPIVGIGILLLVPGDPFI